MSEGGCWTFYTRSTPFCVGLALVTVAFRLFCPDSQHLDRDLHLISSHRLVGSRFRDTAKIVSSHHLVAHNGWCTSTATGSGPFPVRSVDGRLATRSRLPVWTPIKELFTRADERTRALIRSQGGSGAGLCLTTCSMCLITRFEPQHFRVILLRRLRQPRPLTQHSCRCGHPLDPCGHKRAAYARAGVLGKRGCPDLPRSWWTRYHECPSS